MASRTLGFTGSFYRRVRAAWHAAKRAAEAALTPSRWLSAYHSFHVATRLCRRRARWPRSSPASQAAQARRRGRPRVTPEARGCARRTRGRRDSIRPRSRTCARCSKSPAAADYLERVALLTGELYVDDRAHDRRHAIRRSRRTASTSPTRRARPGSDARSCASTPETATTVADLATTDGRRSIRRARRLAWLRSRAQVEPPATSEIVVRDLASGAERVVAGRRPPQGVNRLVSGDDQSVLFVGGDEADQTRSDVYSRSTTARRRFADRSISPDTRPTCMVRPERRGSCYTVARRVAIRRRRVPAAVVAPVAAAARGGRAGRRRRRGRWCGGSAPCRTVVTSRRRLRRTSPQRAVASRRAAAAAADGAPQYVVVDLAGNTTRTVDRVGADDVGRRQHARLAQAQPDGTYRLNSSPATERCAQGRCAP